MSTRAIVVHGHFYQPPRENPWLGVIERQPSAAPFHDWNERITDECYRPSTHARILDPHGRVASLVNNLERMSFNVGPTLMHWLERNAEETYFAILEADRRSIARTGFGTAIAQAHGHLILPLCNARDRRTQVRWGARDFEHRFGRRPAGMWLPETGVDLLTLETLADEGIEFTILAPHQVRKVHSPTRVSTNEIDPRRPYRVLLPSGRAITVFVYDGPLSRAVAFERVLDDGLGLAKRLMSCFRNDHEAQLVHIATDGETFGHHHRFGEMALAYAFTWLEANTSIEVTGYEAYLRRHPATWEAELNEHTAWSCAHGLGRWQTHCGCASGGQPGSQQHWRRPLRNALDGLRDAVAVEFESRGEALFRDPWEARDAYVDLLLRGESHEDAFLAEHLHPGTSLHDARPVALRLLEQQRHAMSMFTSCGWFFDDLAGIETLQVLTYAARVLSLLPPDREAVTTRAFVDALAEARTNGHEPRSGADVWRSEIEPRRVTLERAAIHFAVMGLFRGYGPVEDRGYRVTFADTRRATAGRAQAAACRVTIESTQARESGTFRVAVLHLGDHHFAAGATSTEVDVSTLWAPFERGDLPGTLRALDQCFAGKTASLSSLFSDDQESVLSIVLERSVADAASSIATAYEQHAPLVRALAALGQPIPLALRAAAEVTLTTRFARALADSRLDLTQLEALLGEAKSAGWPEGNVGPFADARLTRPVSDALVRELRRLRAAPEAALDATIDFVRVLVRGGFRPEHHVAQEHALSLRGRANAAPLLAMLRVAE